MAHTDAELIRRILRGDQDAFSPLVKKYQKGVHTLAWRKIGDFHIAQEITQDAFLTAYRKLRTLKNHNQFAGWLYVIAANLCRDWLKKSRLPAVFVLDSPAKPTIRSQAGNSSTPGKCPGSGQQSDETLFATIPIDNTRVTTPKPQWTQTKGPVGGSVQRLFFTANGNLYAGTGADLYTLTDNGNAWRSITPKVPIQGSWQITEHEDTLYIVSDTELIASADGGKTWNSLGTRPEGQLIDLLITDEDSAPQADIIM